MKKLLLLTVLLCVAATTAFCEEAPADPTASWRAPFNEAETNALNTCLSAANLTMTDLEFDRFQIPGMYMLSTVKRMMIEPLYNGVLADAVGKTLYHSAENPARSVMYLNTLLDVAPVVNCNVTMDVPFYVNELLGKMEDEDAVKMQAALIQLGKLPEKVRSSLVLVLWCVQNLQTDYNAAFSQLTAEEIGMLAVTCAGLAGEETPALFTQYGDAANKLGLEKCLRLAEKVDVASFVAGHAALVREMNKFVDVLKASGGDRIAAAIGAINKPVEISTPLGLIVFGTANDDKYTTSPAFIIEPGGDDTYLAPVGCAVMPGGGEGSQTARRVSFAIDMAGDDMYKSLTPVAFGSGFGGSGILFDLAGNDEIRAGNISCGAGVLGCGLVVNRGGDDIYIGDIFAQGAALFGTGLVADDKGCDMYRAAMFAQGFGYTMGIGAIADDEGVDTYFAGGKYLHVPLLPTNFKSLSQAFGFGIRPYAAGGIGIIADASGNDTYTLEVFGQGSSYWLAGGVLTDSDGNDMYTSTHYCIGTGIHLSAGVVLDRAGNDHYFCKNGVGVGGCHDYSVGLLADMGGDDYYQISGCGIGSGHTNGVGILLDSGSGYDGYSAGHEPSIGGASETRNSASIGILIDMGGPRDFYSDGLGNGELRVKSAYGIAYDVPDPEEVQP